MAVPASNTDNSDPDNSGLRWGGCALGFALGGFADGILFHQVLQWHHLMSLVDLPFLVTLEGQVLADGMFHLITYVIAVAGLWLLWRARAAAAGPTAGRVMLATFLIGFGVWHVFDNVVVHWMLGWHHIRLPPHNPLLWDAITFVIGIVFVVWGWLVWTQRPRRPLSPRGTPTALFLATATLVAGPVAALPGSAPAFVTVQFGAATSPADAVLAIAAIDGRVVTADTDTNVWVIEVEQASGARALGDSARILRSASQAFGCFQSR